MNEDYRKTDTQAASIPVAQEAFTLAFTDCCVFGFAALASARPRQPPVAEPAGQAEEGAVLCSEAAVLCCFAAEAAANPAPDKRPLLEHSWFWGAEATRRFVALFKL